MTVRLEDGNTTTVGLDIGNITTVGYVQSREIVLESRLQKANDINSLGSDEIFKFNDESFVINRGEFENFPVKFEKENFLKLVFFALYKTTDSNNVKVSIGIPAGQYNKRRNKMKQFILENNTQTVNDRTITIEDVIVVPEGYGLKAIGAMKKCAPNVKILVVDIGGGTTDIAEFDEKQNFIDGESIKYGLLHVYRETRKILDDEFDVDVTVAEAKKYFDGELSLLNGDVEYKKDIMKKAIINIVNELRGLYPNIKNSNIILTGGGAEKIYPTFKKLYPQTILEKRITANAMGFYKIGVKKWRK